MSNFDRIAEGITVAPLLAQIAAHPELWGSRAARTGAPGSPHYESQDIWLRFRDPRDLRAAADFTSPHFAVWYPESRILNACRPIIFDLMRTVEAEVLGGAMLTRLPAGARILPHTDDGWHARFMNRKAYVILQADEGCLNHCGGEIVTMLPGEAWGFRNDIVHAVENRGAADRIAMIVTMRSAP